MIYKIPIRKGIDDLLELYAFAGNLQGNVTRTNSIKIYKESKGWLSFIFDCELTAEAIDKEVTRRSQVNNKYIKALKNKGEFGQKVDIEIDLQSEALINTSGKITATSSYNMEIINLNNKI